jgi:hypothetical protein
MVMFPIMSLTPQIIIIITFIIIMQLRACLPLGTFLGRQGLLRAALGHPAVCGTWLPSGETLPSGSLGSHLRATHTQ